MTQAITTTYIGPSNTRGSRIKARAWCGTITVPYNGSEGSELNHMRAAQALCEKLGWHRTGWVGGGTWDQRGYTFVSLDSREKF